MQIAARINLNIVKMSAGKNAVFFPEKLFQKFTTVPFPSTRSGKPGKAKGISKTIFSAKTSAIPCTSCFSVPEDFPE
jgi:hypothetical protein